MNAHIRRTHGDAYLLEIGDGTGRLIQTVVLDRSQVSVLMLEASTALYVHPEDKDRDEAEREYEYFAHRRQP